MSSRKRAKKSSRASRRETKAERARRLAAAKARRAAKRAAEARARRKRSAAARKGWETRRANVAKKRRTSPKKKAAAAKPKPKKPAKPLSKRALAAAARKGDRQALKQLEKLDLELATDIAIALDRRAHAEARKKAKALEAEQAKKHPPPRGFMGGRRRRRRPEPLSPSERTTKLVEANFRKGLRIGAEAAREAGLLPAVDRRRTIDSRDHLGERREHLVRRVLSERTLEAIMYTAERMLATMTRRRRYWRIGVVAVQAGGYGRAGSEVLRLAQPSQQGLETVALWAWTPRSPSKRAALEQLRLMLESWLDDHEQYGRVFVSRLIATALDEK